MDVEQRIAALERRVQELECRLAAPEPATHVAEAIPAEAYESPATIDLAVIAKSLLILGGAFLLRAATDSAAVSKPLGVGAGLLYAIAWMVIATRAVRRGRRAAGLCYAVTAAMIAYPIVWEATTRFGVLTANVASIVLAVLSIALIEAGRRYSFPAFGWIAAAGATCNALLLAYETKELIPFFLALTVIGAAAFLLNAKVAGWVLALESDLIALLLIALALLDAASVSMPGAAWSLLLFTIIWIGVSRQSTMQTAAASLIGIAGSSVIALHPAARTIVWSVAALVAAEIARRVSSSDVTMTFAIQSAAWGVFAAAGSGLFAFAVAALGTRETVAIPPAAVLAAVACLAAFLRHRNLILLGIATFAAAAMAMNAVALLAAASSEPLQALVGTAVLVATALLLASIGRRWKAREASQLAIVTLVAAGAKIVVQDLKTATAAMIFITLAVYGSAMLAIARIRSGSSSNV
jgi:hypothetical protein